MSASLTADIMTLLSALSVTKSRLRKLTGIMSWSFVRIQPSIFLDSHLFIKGVSLSVRFGLIVPFNNLPMNFISIT